MKEIILLTWHCHESILFRHVALEHSLHWLTTYTHILLWPTPLPHTYVHAYVFIVTRVNNENAFCEYNNN